MLNGQLSRRGYILGKANSQDHRVLQYTLSLNASMLSGMALFIKTYGAELKDEEFAKRLAKFDPEEIVRRSKTDFSTSSRGLRCARVLLEKYNSKRGGRKLEYRLQG